LGDGLLVYFGYPQAHEDDPQRAVHTGLGITTSLKRLNARLEADQGIQLSIRMGIHTGLVVVGERSAHVEALAHLTRGLEVLHMLSDTPERTQQELVLQTTLGPVLLATKGYVAPEVGQIYARVQELCQQVGETPQIFPTLFGSFYFHRRV
jgi:hypothetical protein